MAVFEVQGPERARTITFSGRIAWLLNRLIEMGGEGLTAADLPAGLRLSTYVHRMRRADIEVGTVYEPSAGAFGGRHGRYTLVSRVELIEEGAT